MKHPNRREDVNTRESGCPPKRGLAIVHMEGWVWEMFIVPVSAIRYMPPLFFESPDREKSPSALIGKGGDVRNVNEECGKGQEI